MNYLIDSNIFIYAIHPQDEKSYRFLSQLQSFAYASISKIEVLGYPELKQKEKELLESLFAMGQKIALTDSIEVKAIQLRQQRRIKLGDATIAATALVENLVLVTRNVEDFKKIKGLRLLNPYEKIKIL